MNADGLFDLPDNTTPLPRPDATPYSDSYMLEAERLIINLPTGTGFMSAEIQASMRRAGWHELDEPRHFGPMLLRLRADGWIEKTGVTTTNARSHGGAASTWRRTTQTRKAAA